MQRYIPLDGFTADHVIEAIAAFNNAFQGPSRIETAVLYGEHPRQTLGVFFYLRREPEDLSHEDIVRLIFEPPKQDFAPFFDDYLPGVTIFGFGGVAKKYNPPTIRYFNGEGTDDDIYAMAGIEEKLAAPHTVIFPDDKIHLRCAMNYISSRTPDDEIILHGVMQFSVCGLISIYNLPVSARLDADGNVDRDTILFYTEAFCYLAGIDIEEFYGIRREVLLDAAIRHVACIEEFGVEAAKPIDKNPYANEENQRDEVPDNTDKEENLI